MAEDPQEGTVFGRFRLREELGHGGMGEVYVAFDTIKSCDVAIKRLRREYAEDQDFQARFRREAQLAARLRDPHVIPIHDFGEIDGQLYIEMRLVDGVDLEKVLLRGPVDPQVSLDVLAQAAAALDAAHAAGLVHRDVKPSNIVLSGDPDRGGYFAYLVDFGVARPLLGHGGSKLTATVGTVGTLAYLAPERIDGKTGDRRADVYSLACVLFECLTRRCPFSGEPVSVMFAHVHKPVPTVTDFVPGLPAAINDVVARGMAKQPEDRYDSAGELIAAARHALAGRPGHIEPAGAGATQRWSQAQWHGGQTPPPPPGGGHAAIPSAVQAPPTAHPSLPPGYPTSAPYGTPPWGPADAGRPRQRVRRTPAVLLAIGTLLEVLAFTVLPWYFRGDDQDFDGATSHTSFGDIHDALTGLSHTAVASHITFGVSKAYFGGVAWGLLALTAILAGIAVAPPGRRSRLPGIAGMVAALVSFALTLSAIRPFDFDKVARDYFTGRPTPGYATWLAHANFGAWFAILGFPLMGVAAILGSRRS